MHKVSWCLNKTLLILINPLSIFVRIKRICTTQSCRAAQIFLTITVEWATTVSSSDTHANGTFCLISWEENDKACWPGACGPVITRKCIPAIGFRKWRGFYKTVLKQPFVAPLSASTFQYFSSLAWTYWGSYIPLLATRAKLLIIITKATK